MRIELETTIATKQFENVKIKIIEDVDDVNKANEFITFVKNQIYRPQYKDLKYFSKKVDAEVKNDNDFDKLMKANKMD